MVITQSDLRQAGFYTSHFKEIPGAVINGAEIIIEDSVAFAKGILESSKERAILSPESLSALLEIADKIPETLVNNAESTANIFNQLLNKQNVDKTQIASLLSEFELSGETYDKLISYFQTTSEELPQVILGDFDKFIVFLIENGIIDPSIFARLQEEFKDAANRELFDGLINGTGEFSKEFGDKFKDILSAAGIKLESTIDGYNYTGPVEDYLLAVEEIIKQIFGAGAQEAINFITNRRQIAIGYIAQQIEKTAPIAKLSTTDFKEIAKSLNEVGVSAEQAAILVWDLGFAVEEFYQTASGEFALKNNLNSIEKINARINELTKDGNDLNDKEIQQHRLLLDLVQQIKRAKEDEAIDFMSPDESVPLDRETDIYLRLLENVGQLGTMLGDFQKDYQMTATNFINLTRDTKMAQAIRDAFAIPAEEFMVGSALLEQVVQKAGASRNGEIITFGEEQAAAITDSLQKSTESIIQARIDSIDAQIKVLESFKALEGIDFSLENDIDAAFALNDFVYTDNEGNEYTLKTPAEFHDYVMKNMPMDEIIKIAADLGITYNVETQEWVDAAGNTINPDDFGMMLMRELLGDTQRLNTFLNLSVTPKIENIDTMSEQEIEDYKKVLQEQIDEATKKLNESTDLTEEQKEPLRKILSPEVPHANAEELYAAIEKYNAALASI